MTTGSALRRASCIAALVLMVTSLPPAAATPFVRSGTTVRTTGDADARHPAVAGKVPVRVVTVSWTAAENARLRRMAVYMHRTAAATQQAAVHIVWYLLGGATGRAAPVSLPPAGTAASYTNVWYQSDLSALDGLRAHFGVNSVDATRIAVYAYSYLLALRGV